MSDILSEALFASGLDEFLHVQPTQPNSPGYPHNQRPLEMSERHNITTSAVRSTVGNSPRGVFNSEMAVPPFRAQTRMGPVVGRSVQPIQPNSPAVSGYRHNQLPLEMGARHTGTPSTVRRTVGYSPRGVFHAEMAVPPFRAQMRMGAMVGRSVQPIQPNSPVVYGYRHNQRPLEMGARHTGTPSAVRRTVGYSPRGVFHAEMAVPPFRAQTRMGPMVGRSVHPIQPNSPAVSGYRHNQRPLEMGVRQQSPIAYPSMTPVREYYAHSPRIAQQQKRGPFSSHVVHEPISQRTVISRQLTNQQPSTAVINTGRANSNPPLATRSAEDPSQDCLAAPRLSPQYYPTYCESAPNVSKCVTPPLPTVVHVPRQPVNTEPTPHRRSAEPMPRKLSKPSTESSPTNLPSPGNKENGVKSTMTEEDEIEQIQVDTYVDYFPPKLRSGLAHPDNVVETVSLNSVSSPEIRYHMSIPERVIDMGYISALQLEAALYACQAHEKRLPSGERVGYLVGDGAGVGKGRIIATIIYENYLLGRKRALWLSVSSDLKFDAERDLADIGAEQINVYALNKLKYARINGAENGHIKKGVLFSTYASLIGECRSAPNTAYSSRLKQVLQWCGKDFDGVIVFDECHRAKNLCPTAGKSTKTGKFVLELQRALPSARVVYASATGATEPRNMAYMTRIGLWGYRQTFETFNEFIHAVENRGVGAMEMVAMDMKLRGLYLARQLSFKGVGFQVEEVELPKSFIDVYDEAVKVWMECRRQFARALSHMPNEMPKNQKVWAQFWSAHQRFFKYLCISAKVDTCVKIALNAIANGKCVVIGLQSTGESQMLDYLEDNGEVTEFVSTAKAVLQSLIEKHFPTYDDNQASAIDDFERMFLSMDGGGEKKDSRKRRANNIQPAKKIRRREQSLESEKLYAERESGGNSEADDSDDYEDCDDDEEDGDSEESDADAGSEGGSKFVKDKEAEDLVDAMMAELSSDDESDENSRRSASLFGASGDAADKLGPTDFNPTSFGEINPFCLDLTEEDPWADNQLKTDDSLNKIDKPKVEKKRKIKVPKRKKASAVSKTNAEDFIKSTNLISDADDNDGCMNLTQVKTDLLAAVERLGKCLPSNTLDQLINQLGGPQYVAEMTGRRGRVITKESTGKIQYELRNADSDAPVEFMNMEEKEKFMNGEKLVAIISEAASSGISLQSDRRANNHRRRVHITLELPWSADKAVQQFGRTHRSNQVSAPEYLFLISELAGEKRFASIVAKRLESLGALTHGDRRATESRDLSQFNIDTKYGREALDIVFRSIVGAMEPLIPPPTTYKAGDFFADMRVYMEGVGLLSKSDTNVYTVERDALYIPKFLNRLLGLPVNAQNSIFQYFSDVVAELIKQAKLDGTFDMGIMDIGIGSDRVQKAETRKFEGSVVTNDFHVEMHKICLHRGVSWEEANAILKLHCGAHDGFYVSTVGFQKRISVALVYGIGKSYDGENHRLYAITRPNTGRSPKSEPFEELRLRFRAISAEEAKEHWTEQYDKLDAQCHHRYYHGKCNNEAQGRFCEVGRRTRTYFVLSGSVICVWPALEEILGEGKHSKHRRMQIVRVRTDNNQRVIGLLVLPIHVRKLVELLEQRCK